MADPDKESSYLLEVRYEVWNDDVGSHFKVGPDRIMDLVEVRQIERDGQEVARLTLTAREAELVCQALAAAAADLRKRLSS